MSSVFISDIHLSPQQPALAQLLLKFLQSPEIKDAQALYILGDLFDAWLGDDATPPELSPITQTFKSLAESGKQIFYLRGNRDFLVGEDLATRCGFTLLDDPCVIEILGQPTLLMHGDLLCTDDHEYQSFRKQVRNPQWQKQFLSLLVPERIALAKKARETSKTETAQKADDIMDANQQTVEQYMREYGVTRLIHGHTHRPAIHHFQLNGKDAERIVLGDWHDLPSYLSINDHDCLLSDPRVQ